MELMLPTIAPDMTLYSFLALTQRLNGASNAKDLSNILFSSPSAALQHDFPSNLNQFCRNTGQAFGNAIDVANNNTVLPYFLRFRPEQLKNEALSLMSGSTVEPLKFILGLPAGPTGATMPLHFCTECLNEDINYFGYAYWHRVHQLPSVLTCHKHLVPLRITNLRIDGRGRSGLFLPDDSGVQQSITLLPLDRGQSILNRLSILSTMALNRELPSFFSATSLRSTYLHGLKQQGLLTTSGRIRAQEFIQRLTKHYTSISSLEPFHNIVGTDFIDSLMHLVRKPRGHYHTACHLILIDFLFGDWDLFNSVYQWEKQMDLPFNQPNGTKHTKAKSLNENLENRLIALTTCYNNGEASFSALAKKFDIDVNTAMKLAGKLGLAEIPRKPRTLNVDITSNVISLLKDGQPLKAVAAMTNLSISTIDRIIYSEANLQEVWRAANKDWKREQVRNQFQKYLANNPTITVTELRHTYNSGYRWLYLHDFEWLSKHLPPKTPIKRKVLVAAQQRIDWSKRDEECLVALKDVDLTNLESWERIKPRAILRRLPKLTFSPRLERLPKSKAWIVNELAKYSSNNK